MTRSLVTGIAVILCAAASVGSAAAQDGAVYREGLPAVLTPAEDAVTRPVAGFREAYARAGRPRAVVFWMRALSDAVADPTVIRTDRAGAAALGAERSRGAAVVTGGWAESRQTVIGDLPQPADDALGEPGSAAAEAAFANALLGEGVRLVDRAVITRLSATEAAGQKAAETAALRKMADVLIEVTAGGAGPAPVLTYVVTAIDLADGSVLARVAVDPDDLEEAADYEAVPGGGYQRILTAESLGAALSAKLRERLARAW